MSKKTKIAFPNANRPISWYTEPATFVAFGQADAGVQSVQGRLLLGSTVVGKATTLWNPAGPDHFWIIVFEDVPFTQTGQTYTLEVLEQGTLLKKREGLKVRGVHGIGVSYPLTDDKVCPCFVAFGSTAETGYVTGALVKNSTETGGNTLRNGPAWVVSFTGLTPGTTYDKLVARVGSSSDDSSKNITVDYSACVGVD